MISPCSDKILYKILSDVGVRHDLNGYIFIKDFIRDYLESNNKIVNILEWYKIEAARLNTSATKVERAIRQAAKIIEKANKNSHNEIFTDDIYSNKAFLLAVSHYAEAYYCDEIEATG